MFKGRYKAIIVEEESYFLELVRYIHRNPLKAKIVEKITDHQWTSHRGYMRDKEAPEWLSRDIALTRFDEHERSAKMKLDTFVKKEVPKELALVLDRVRWPVMLGGEKFTEKIKEIIKGKKIEEREMPQYKEIERKISAQKIAKMFIEKQGWDERVYEKSKERSLVEKRMQFVYVCRNLQISCSEIARVVGNVNFSLITYYSNQIEKKCKRDRKYKGKILELEELASQVF